MEQSNSVPPIAGRTGDTTTAGGDTMAEAINQATDAVDQMNTGPSALGRGEETLNNLNTVVGQIATVAGPFEPLFEKLRLFTGVMDKIAEVFHSVNIIRFF